MHETWITLEMGEGKLINCPDATHPACDGIGFNYPLRYKFFLIHVANSIIITEDGNYLIESKWNRSIRCKLSDYTWKVPRVPNQPGKSLKMTACLESVGKFWNFMILNKNPGKMVWNLEKLSRDQAPPFLPLVLGMK